MKSHIASNEEQIRRLVNDWAKAVRARDMGFARVMTAAEIIERWVKGIE